MADDAVGEVDPFFLRQLLVELACYADGVILVGHGDAAADACGVSIGHGARRYVKRVA